MPLPPFSMTPIGVIKTPYTEKHLTPRQPGLSPEPPEGVITLFPGFNFEQALEDLDGFERVWILSWFDRNEGWTPKVLPPRAGSDRKGVFATRSPHRPNPIGLSLCRLLGIRGRTIRVEDPDLLDGTPILDIKPYIAYAEAFPGAAAGWLDSLAQQGAEPFEVALEPLAATQHEWLQKEHGIDLMSQCVKLLSRYPHPHPSRRTKLLPDGEHVLGIKSWRVRYALAENVVTILRINSGYEAAAVAVAAGKEDALHDQAAHVAFHALWPLP